MLISSVLILLIIGVTFYLGYSFGKEKGLDIIKEIKPLGKENIDVIINHHQQAIAEKELEILNYKTIISDLVDEIDHLQGGK